MKIKILRVSIRLQIRGDKNFCVGFFWLRAFAYCERISLKKSCQLNVDSDSILAGIAPIRNTLGPRDYCRRGNSLYAKYTSF